MLKIIIDIKVHTNVIIYYFMNKLTAVSRVSSCYHIILYFILLRIDNRQSYKLQATNQMEIIFPY
jgi:hypothetical protein